MANLDERLRHELKLIAEPADPAGLVDLVIRRADRRRLIRRAQVVLLALTVVVGSIGGVLILSRVFRTDLERLPGASAAPITPHANGRIAFAYSTTSGMRLETIEPDGSDRAVVPTPEGLPWLPAWSPDGTRLAVAIFPQNAGPRGLWVMDADGSNPVQVAQADNVSQPSWSPDGGWVAYTAEAGSTSAIHIVRPDGSDDRVLYEIPSPGTTAVFSAVFSPDGTKILFDQGTDSGFDIFVMNANGSNVRQLTSTDHYYDPTWSPDGTRIAFVRQGTGAQSDIYVMDADGSNVAALTHGAQGQTNLYPAWSPDETKIAYLAGRQGGPGDLVVMNADGSEPSTLVAGRRGMGVLGIAWQPLPIVSSESETPVQGGSPAVIPSGATPLILYPGETEAACNLTRIDGAFVDKDDVPDTAYVYTRVEATGCPEAGSGQQVLGVSEDGKDIFATAPLECLTLCQAFGAPDLNGDGFEEIAIASETLADGVPMVRLYSLTQVDGTPTILTIRVEQPGDPPYLSAGPMEFAWGGPAGFVGAAYCGQMEGDPPTSEAGFVVWRATFDRARPLVHETLLRLMGGFLAVVATHEYRAPDTAAGLPLEGEPSSAAPPSTRISHSSLAKTSR